ncbi:hypothetical protein HXX76_011957 [Chlamydomonas incerta]|uniref:Uncharacterized protein n=1 Tax=Chlamydomonas incerta TaxID=51695 RepID=A0A835SWT4_CHLIN|nr:hypothetical protein HXX76_011957 [Chlamydomonas incerta]|eukprot:KAG2427970.1 hypothetical protein HXX76_011957 [Chlamydomonas incerta]
MCYWAMQSLPAPPTGYNATNPAGPCPPGACSWTGAVDYNQMLIIHDLGQLAAAGGEGGGSKHGAHSTHVALGDRDSGPAGGGDGAPTSAPSPVVWGGCTMGWVGRKALCDAGLSDTELCGPAALTRTGFWWPTASVILRLDGSTEMAAAVKRQVEEWRTFKAAHESTIHHPLVWWLGWGFAGDVPGIVAKLVPCDLIPPSFQYTRSGGKCDVLDARSGRLEMDEALEVWAQACNAFYHPQLFPDFGPATCPPAPPTPPEVV